MQIKHAGIQTFGTKSWSYEMVKQEPKNFYKLSDDGKLNVLYDMLTEQKEDIVTLSRNQEKIQSLNKYNTDLITAVSDLATDSKDKSLALNDKVYNNNLIDVIA